MVLLMGHTELCPVTLDTLCIGPQNVHLKQECNSSCPTELTPGTGWKTSQKELNAVYQLLNKRVTCL